MQNQKLIIIKSNGEVTEIILSTLNKSIITIGRDSLKSDIVINDGFVSGIHGKFILEYDKVLYEDTNSTNGTYIDSLSATNCLKNSTDKVELKEGVILRIISKEGTAVLILFSSEVMEQTWKKVHITNDKIIVGRLKTSDITLEHPGVSKHHASFYEEKGNYYIENMNSVNGFLINENYVSDKVILKNQDVIQILDYQLIYNSGIIFYKTINLGITLDANNINKIVGKGKKKKKILNSVNCHIGSNEFVAIVGGSGAGKSTLMNAISGFDNEISGDLLCNGIDLQINFNYLKNIIGYVPQQDIIYENLTLKNMLYYTAKMKMPDDTDDNEIEVRINSVLEMVELTEHQDTFIRKLSGGQKKRASIGVELLADPKLFFLDEPTSGLDPGTEKNLMMTLSRLSKTQDKTIVMVTHTTQSLHLCDKVIFMGPGGKLCFSGSVEEAKMFFDTDDLVNIYNIIAENPDVWMEQFIKFNKVEINEEKKKADINQKKTSGLRQLHILISRYISLIKNDMQRILLLLLQPLLIGLLLYIVSSKDIFDIYEDTKSMLFSLSCSAIWIGLFNSIQEICKERTILKREYMANLKLPVYILSKVFVQTIIGLVQSIILVTVFLVSIRHFDGGIFIHNIYPEMLLTVWLTVLAASCIGLVISAIVKSGDNAMVIAPFILILQLLFSGILFKLNGLSNIISYFTVSRWSVGALGSISDLNSMTLKMQINFPDFEHKAEDFFEFSKPHLLTMWGVLVAIMIITSICSMIILSNLKKDNR